MIKNLVVLVSFIIASSGIQAATTFTGTYSFASATGNVASLAYNGTAIPNVTVGNLLKVGVTTGSSSGNSRATGWTLDPGTVGDLDGGIGAGNYYQFSLTAASGYTLDMTSFTFGVGRSGTGPRSFQWRSSLDNYETAFSNYTSTNAALSNTSGALSYKTDATTSATGNVLNLSSLTGLSGVTFRFYGYNSEATGGTGGLEGNFTFAGAFNAAAAAAYTWTGNGSGGTWQNGQSGNFGTTYNNATDSAVTFSGTSGDVTVSSGVQAGSLTFTTGGYALNSGSLTVGQGSITTDTGTTTINSVLEGTAGLIKSGAGALVLTGANTVDGAVTITGGTLQIGSDGALGNAANDIANNGTLKTTSNIALGAGRDITGSGTLDIADGTTLTVNGVTSTSGLTLANTGTLAFNNAASNPGNLTTTYTSGTARVTGNLNLGATDKIVNVAGGGALEVAGSVSLTTGAGTELTKEGAGTLILSGSGSSISRVQIGRTGATPTAGGTLRVADSASLGAQEMYFNYGTLEAANNLSTSAGVSLGGRTGAETIIGGSGGSADVTFNGAARFFGATGTGGEFALKVNNNTTLAGGISGAAGTRTGVTLGGAGTLNITGNSAAFTDRIITSDTVKLVVNSSLGSAVNVGNGSLLGGSGSVGALTLSTGATLTPGNSPGLLTATSATFQSGSNLNWEIFNAVGTAGVEWDLLSVTGNLNVAALSSGSMNLVLNSLSALPNTVGALAGFNSNDTYSWTFARAASITGATGVLTSGQDVTSLFSINGTSFNLGTAPTSGWKVMTGTETVSGTTYQTLNLLAVPEPSAQSLLAFGMAALVAVRSLRRKQS
jgi:autotransporter-associated beta strand protein